MLPKTTKIIAALLFTSLSGAAMAQSAAPQPAQPYAGQQSRAVTSLSAEDISQLLGGGGWGLAKPAELNGYPGPAHVLELADKLALTADQRTKVERIFKRMQARAKSIGARYVAAELAIDEVFRSGKAQTGGLETRLRDAERLRAELRRAHLQAHIETTPLLTHGQRIKYDELRGYGAHGGHHHMPHHKH
jgi:hypothetical protein